MTAVAPFVLPSIGTASSRSNCWFWWTTWTFLSGDCGCVPGQCRGPQRLAQLIQHLGSPGFPACGSVSVPADNPEAPCQDGVPCSGYVPSVGAGSVDAVLDGVLDSIARIQRLGLDRAQLDQRFSSPGRMTSLPATTAHLRVIVGAFGIRCWRGCLGRRLRVDLPLGL